MISVFCWGLTLLSIMGSISLLPLGIYRIFNGSVILGVCTVTVGLALIVFLCFIYLKARSFQIDTWGKIKIDKKKKKIGCKNHGFSINGRGV